MQVVAQPVALGPGGGEGAAVRRRQVVTQVDGAHHRGDLHGQRVEQPAVSRVQPLVADPRCDDQLAQLRPRRGAAARGPSPPGRRRLSPRGSHPSAVVTAT